MATNILTHNKVIELFRDWSLSKSPMINDFGYGDVYDISTSKGMNFPYMWMDHQTDSTIKVANFGMQPNYSYIFLFLDQINIQDNVFNTNGNKSDNRADIMSDMYQVGQDFVNDLYVIYSKLGINIEGDIITSKVYDETTDKVCGWAFSITLSMKHFSCSISSVSLPSSCSPARIVNSNNTFNVIVNSGSLYVLPDSINYVNEVEVSTSAATENSNIYILNNNNEGVGDLVGSDWIVDNSIVNINGSQVGDIFAENNLDISVKLNGVENGSWNESTQTWEISATNAWVRPNGWVALDNVTTGTNNFSGVFAVYETQKSVCTIQITFPGGGTRLINWGDGTTQAALNNTIYAKVYDYSTITSDVLQDEGGFNYKTVAINFPLNSATSLFLERNTTATLIPNSRSLNWLDVALDCSTLTSMYCSSQAISNKLQRLRVYNVGATIDGAGANFTQLVSLKVLKFPFEKMQSSNQVFTNYCGDFRDENDNPFNLNLTINTGSLFNFFSNGLLTEFGNVSAPLSTSGQGVFTNNIKLIKIGTISVPTAANLVDFISNCVNLESVVNITTSSACTSITNLGIGNKKCRGFIISNCAGVTSATNAFNQMVSMETLILTGMTRGFNIDDCNLSATAIDALFTSLGTASGSQTINVRRNPGSATCTTSIATTKGFTVVVA